MGIYLTNGINYVAFTETRKIIKVNDINAAFDFVTPDNALMQRKIASKKCNGYYYLNTNKKHKSGTNAKRKKFTQEERKAIYRKTKGHCYICGEFVEFESFEIEHKKPLAVFCNPKV